MVLFIATRVLTLSVGATGGNPGLAGEGVVKCKVLFDAIVIPPSNYKN